MEKFERSKILFEQIQKLKKGDRYLKQIENVIKMRSTTKNKICQKWFFFLINYIFFFFN